MTDEPDRMYVTRGEFEALVATVRALGREVTPDTTGRVGCAHCGATIKDISLNPEHPWWVTSNNAAMFKCPDGTRHEP